MADDFDPLDLAMLVSGWRAKSPVAYYLSTLSIERAEFLVEVAKLLHRLWQEYGGIWDGVWAYEVAEPLGAWIAENKIASALPVEQAALALIRAGIACAKSD